MTSPPISDTHEVAEKDYHAVRYFQFGNKPDASYILTSDPLSYLKAWFDNRISQEAEESKKQPLKKAKYFVNLSQEFYTAFLAVKMPSKGVLLYYSFLNLVKAYLSANGREMETTEQEHHGLSLNSNGNGLKLAKSSGQGNGTLIFQTFAELLEQPVHSSAGDILIDDILQSLIEIHGLGASLDSWQGKPKYLPIDLHIMCKNRKQLYYELSYDKKQDKRLDTTKLKSVSEIIKNEELGRQNNKSYYKSIKFFDYNNDDQGWKDAYQNIVKEVNNLNITTLLTRGGYRYYLYLGTPRLHRLCNTLAFAFYIGSVARYRPTLNETMLRGKHRAIIEEAVNACPKQFFYHLAGHITQEVYVVPMTKLD
ncbi:YaaC family protein [Microscilla marina]|uniref:Uncharacterized protein n=1 Tax=Microscilla marina ATCC 23134 TaxID=313606 RepID=A1ZU95_MICM2|nr:YaaC family protein [Microscilla marina]EAY26066.1 conserved hypothetical protein [Microscilla marina ATCC 23134]